MLFSDCKVLKRNFLKNKLQEFKENGKGYIENVKIPNEKIDVRGDEIWVIATRTTTTIRNGKPTAKSEKVETKIDMKI